MQLTAVVCRVWRDGAKTDELISLEPVEFVRLLDAAVPQAEEANDLAQLERELAGYKPSANNASPEGAILVGETPMPTGTHRKEGEWVSLPAEVLTPLVAAKTRGELRDKVNALLAPFFIMISEK